MDMGKSMRPAVIISVEALFAKPASVVLLRVVGPPVTLSVLWSLEGLATSQLACRNLFIVVERMVTEELRFLVGQALKPVLVLEHA
jgi:hypothetical protein